MASRSLGIPTEETSATMNSGLQHFSSDLAKIEALRVLRM